MGDHDINEVDLTDKSEDLQALVAAGTPDMPDDTEPPMEVEH